MMRSIKQWIGFQAVVAVVGIALVITGMYGVFMGVQSLPGQDALQSNPSLDNTFAFQSALIIGLGLSFLLVAARPAVSGLLLASLCSIVFLGGVARIVAWAIFGLPHWSLVVMTIGELVVPPLLLLWRAWIARGIVLRGDTAGRADAADVDGSQPTEAL